MLRTFSALMRDEQGVIVSAELVLVLTIAVLAMVVGLHSVAKAVTMELSDISNAFGALDQSFCYSGLVKSHHAAVSGSAFSDRQDDCDCSIIGQPKPRAKVDASGWGSEAGGGGHH